MPTFRQKFESGELSADEALRISVVLDTLAKWFGSASDERELVEFDDFDFVDEIESVWRENLANLWHGSQDSQFEHDCEEMVDDDTGRALSLDPEF